MEINIENPEIATQFKNELEKLNAVISIVSTDDQDKGKIYNITNSDVLNVDEDCEGLIIWWKYWNGFKWLDNSAHFEYYTLGSTLHKYTKP